MNTKKLLDRITKLPTPINHTLLSMNFFPKKFYGKSYRHYLENTLLKNKHQFDNTNKLLDIINHSISRVPFYRALYHKHSFKTIDDFKQHISFIDKDIVMSHFDDFIDEHINMKDYVEGTTGGTSGKPLKLIIPKNRHIFELSTMHFLWSNAGWQYDTRGVIRNHNLPENKTFQINPITKEFIFDNFKLNDNYLMDIYNTIKRYKIRYIHAYPSAAFELSQFIKKNSLDPSVITSFLSGSENVFDYQRKLICEELGIGFFNWYGHSEKLVLGGYCPYTSDYHLEPTYGYFELIDSNNRVINTPGEVGEIVGTSLHNYGMPLIRYKTGDFAEYVGDYCQHCDRHLPIIRNIKGRWSGDKIYNHDNTYVTTTALNLHNDLYTVIDGHQYIQNKKGELIIQIIKSKLYKEEHENRILQHYRSKLSVGTEVQIKYVNQLTKQPNGKFLHLVSNINIKP